MKTLTAGQLAALAAGNVVIVQLVKFAFPSGTIALNTSNLTLNIGGVDFIGAVGLGTVSPITDKPGEIQGMTFELSAVSADMITLAMDEAGEVQGTPVTVGYLLLDSVTLQPIDTVMVDWLGTLDTMATSEDGQNAVVRVTAESKAVDLMRGNPLTYSDADQQSLYPGDRAYEYVTDQADKPVVWPAREWFFK